MVISDYFRSIEELLNNSKLIADKNIDFKEFDIDEGMIRGKLLFLGGYVFTFMEYISIGKDRPKYRFNLSDSKGDLIFRYDNAAHHQNIHTYPHHKHTPTEIKPSREMGLADVISEIEMMILNDFVK
ncbi:MAG: hypothetical protein JXA98_05630 [Methanosarcinaceae archaeon]|nr:hypothetical protein [Methanosarcinaceae archaeon]